MNADDPITDPDLALVEEFDLVAHPNDGYFRGVFSDLDNATAFFQSHLSTTLVSAIDWSSITNESASYVRRNLQQAHSDLLFSVRAGDAKLLLYLLFEHQTTVDPTMPLRVLGYVTEVLLDHERQHGLPLPAVLPFVLHQGPDRWTVSTQFQDLFDLPQELRGLLGPHLPSFEHLLLDLSRHSPAQEEKDDRLRIILQLMKAAREKTLAEFFTWLSTEYENVLLILPDTVLRFTLLYAYHADSNLDPEAIVRNLLTNLPTNQTIMSLAEKLKIQGRAEGRVQGRAEGISQGISQGLSKGNLIGQLQLMQRMLGKATSTTEELLPMDSAEIRDRFDALEREYNARFKSL